MDMILNGQASGDVASKLMENNFDAGALRPYFDTDGQSYITVNQNGKPTRVPINNAQTTLRKDEWMALDMAVIKAAKPRLRAVADLRGAGLQVNIPNGMGTTVFQHQTQSDISAADISMDGIREGEADRPQYNLVNLPLPIIHKDFQFSAREIAVSRNGGSPLDTTMAELAGRRVAEEVEKLTLGVNATYSYGGGSIYGYTNFPSRLTKTITAPTGSNGPTVVTEVLAMIQQSHDNYYYGPFVLYTSPIWNQFLDSDYDTGNRTDATLRDRLMKIDGISAIKQADYMTGTELVLVQQSADVARMVIGMDITTAQWDSHGGMQKNFKVMTIMVPQLRADINGNTGIVHGAIA